MKVLVLAGLLGSSPLAAAEPAESTIACRVEETQRAAGTRVQSAPAAQAARTAPGAQRSDMADVQRPESPRRRSGKPIPDAELMRPRLAL